MQGFYERSDFDILATIQSQYAASGRIVSLGELYWQMLDPTSDVSLMVAKMVNPATAVGVGLDVWARIVAVTRQLTVKRMYQEHLGFRKLWADSYTNSFNNAPFYNPDWYDSITLDDETLRNYVFVKALLNIGTSTLYDINMICGLIVPSGLRVVHSGTMALRLLATEEIAQDKLSAFLNLPWCPTGVGVDYYKVVGPTFGFNGSKLQPFNQGAFVTTRPITLFN